MQTIQIEVQDTYMDKCTQHTPFAPKNTMIDTIHIHTQDDAADFAKDRKALESVLQDYTQNRSKNFTKLDSDYWRSVKDRLLQSNAGFLG